MVIHAAAQAQMAELEAHRTEAQRADLEADPADKLDSLQPFDHCFTNWKRAGQHVGRNGIVVKFDADERTIVLLEVVPDSGEPCVACGRVASPRSSTTYLMKVAYTDVTEIHRTEWAGRNGWGLKLLGAILDEGRISTGRSQQILSWVQQLGKIPA